MVLHDLPSFIRNMGIQLHENALEEALKQVAIDGEYKIKVFFIHIARIPNRHYISTIVGTARCMISYDCNGLTPSMLIR